jgi:hypothetical protein
VSFKSWLETEIEIENPNGYACDVFIKLPGDASFSKIGKASSYGYASYSLGYVKKTLKVESVLSADGSQSESGSVVVSPSAPDASLSAFYEKTPHYHVRQKIKISLEAVGNSTVKKRLSDISHSVKIHYSWGTSSSSLAYERLLSDFTADSAVYSFDGDFVIISEASYELKGMVEDLNTGLSASWKTLASVGNDVAPEELKPGTIVSHGVSDYASLDDSYNALTEGIKSATDADKKAALVAEKAKLCRVASNVAISKCATVKVKNNEFESHGAGNSILNYRVGSETADSLLSDLGYNSTTDEYTDAVVYGMTTDDNEKYGIDSYVHCNITNSDGVSSFSYENGGTLGASFPIPGIWLGKYESNGNQVGISFVLKNGSPTSADFSYRIVDGSGFRVRSGSVSLGANAFSAISYNLDGTQGLNGSFADAKVYVRASITVSRLDSKTGAYAPAQINSLWYCSSISDSSNGLAQKYTSFLLDEAYNDSFFS